MFRELLWRLKGKPEIRPQHEYQCTITSERFTVTTVGRLVTIIRHDAERRPEQTVKKGSLRRAIHDGYVVHDEDKCATCQRDNV